MSQSSTPIGAPAVRIRSFQPDRPLDRAQRPAGLTAVLENNGEKAVTIRTELALPDGVRVLRASAPGSLRLGGGQERRLTWSIEAATPGPREVTLRVRIGDTVLASSSTSMNFLEPVEKEKHSYIPEPQPVRTQLLIGAHNCPLWEADRPEMWANVLKHPERTPALGFYAQENPEVADWETKWAVEHGVSFFVYCWYRTSQGEPVKMQFGSAIHDALFKSRFRDKMNYTIMWENQVRGKAGVADEHDLMTNLLPFWIENYFKDPGYLKVDNKPVLFVYRPDYLIQDLGGEENVRRAFEKMRQACKDAGFDGLYVLGEYRGQDPNDLRLLKRLGMEYSFAYCWYVPDNPTPAQSIETQMRYIENTQRIGVLPQVVTVSQAWSGWADEGTIWKIPPSDFETLLRRAKSFIETLPENELGRRMLLLDNWNEWGEGHYIAPYREYGFGYLDAVRRVFAADAGPHTDLLPEDVGLGPYDSAYKNLARQAEEDRKLVARPARKPGGSEEGLIAWWAFDEKPDDRAALDYTGNRMGAVVRDAKRAPGIDGNALVCDGGSAVVANDPRLSPTEGLTIECWLRTDVTGQQNRWFVNRVYSGGIATGYRFGLLDDRPCFEVPLTDWSHHLQADIPVPLGRWVHLAGTYDGKTMRIYVDGVERGTMERPGPIRPNQFPITLGSYETGHPSHFVGLLDEVRLYGRALSAGEVRARFEKLAPKR